MKRITTIEYKPGTQGPPGPQGPPGTSALPISSQYITYLPDGRTVEQVLTALLFVDLTIPSFSTPQTIFETGQVINSLTFNWSYNKPITSQSISGSSVVTPSLLLSDRAKTVSLSGLSSNGTITLTAGDGSVNPDVTKSISIQFLKGVFYGSAPLGTINSAFVNNLTKSLQSTKQKTVTVTLGAGQYGWFAVPVAYGTASFKLNGFNGGMEAPLTISVTNAYGSTENYYVYRTTNSNLGVTEIQSL